MAKQKNIYKKLRKSVTEEIMSFLIREMLSKEEIKSLANRCELRYDGVRTSTVPVDILIEDLAKRFLDDPDSGLNITKYLLKKIDRESLNLSNMTAKQIKKVYSVERIMSEGPERGSSMIISMLIDPRSEINEYAVQLWEKINEILDESEGELENILGRLFEEDDDEMEEDDETEEDEEESEIDEILIELEEQMRGGKLARIIDSFKPPRGIPDDDLMRVRLPIAMATVLLRYGYEEFTRALELFPDSREAQNNLQYIYKRQNRYDKVLSPHNRLLTNAIFTRIPGITLPRGSYLVDLQYKNWFQEAKLTTDMFDSRNIRLVGAPAKRKVRVQVGIVGFRYGLTNDLSLGLIAKYFSRELKIQVSAIEGQQKTTHTMSTPTARGLGDMQFLFKYHLWGRRKTHLSFYNLLTIPIGREKTATDFVSIRTISGEVQNFHIKRKIPLGADSFDVTPGLAFTTFIDPAVLHFNIQYRFTDGKYVSDEFRTDCGIIYPLNKAVNATIETGYRWRDDTRQELLPPESGEDIDLDFTEKGGHTVFFSPGLQFEVSRGLKLEMGVKIPVVKQKEGWAEEYIFHVGMARMVF